MLFISWLKLPGYMPISDQSIGYDIYHTSYIYMEVVNKTRHLQQKHSPHFEINVYLVLLLSQFLLNNLPSFYFTKETWFYLDHTLEYIDTNWMNALRKCTCVQLSFSSYRPSVLLTIDYDSATEVHSTGACTRLGAWGIPSNMHLFVDVFPRRNTD